MEIIVSEAKQCGSLTLDDFKRYPIWTLVDEGSETCIAPVVMKGTTFRQMDIDNFESLFIFAHFLLRDGTEIEGEIFYDTKDGNVYGLVFYHQGEKFHFPGIKYPASASLNDLLLWLGKKREDVNPLYYYTNYTFENGKAISGMIDLESFQVEI